MYLKYIFSFGMDKFYLREMFRSIHRSVAFLTQKVLGYIKVQRTKVNHICITRVFIHLRFGYHNSVPRCIPRYQTILASLRYMHPHLVVPEDILLDKPQITLATSLGELLPLMLLQMPDEVIHILNNIPRRGEYSGGFQTEGALYRRSVIMLSVKMIDSLFVIRAPIATGATLVGQL